MTDIFGTKPLFYSLEKSIISISSLRSTLEINDHKKILKCEPNTIYIFDLEKSELSVTKNYFKFDLIQHRDTFDNWNESFLNSVRKRFVNSKHDIILPLSSGHDSGAIACAFDILGIKYYTYSFFKDEHRKVLSKRIIKRLFKEPLKTRFKNELGHKKIREEMILHLENNCDPFYYGPNNDNLTIDGRKDPGAHGLSYILKKVQKMNKNIKIVASAQGGDEIFFNNQKYTFDKPNPEKFGDNLSTLFPWQNFYYGAQMSYLAKEESVGGSYGLETRYPLLDKYVVQEYLNLLPKLKNQFYKSPITNFLIENNYPLRLDNRKSGFNP